MNKAVYIFMLSLSRRLFQWLRKGVVLIIKIIADSTCDLTEELLQKHDISIIPLCIAMGDINYHDGVDIKPNDIFEWSEKENSTPKTAAPLLNDVIEVMKSYVEEKREIIFFGISEEMSSTCNVVRLAAEFYEYKKIYIINSKNLSTGIGLQILKAATMVQENHSAEFIVRYIETFMRERVRSSFIVDTLTYLYRGGRCSSITALIGNKLMLKPMIIVNNGKMEVGKKYRGNNKKALMNYAYDLKPELLKADPERVFITFSEYEDEMIQELYEFILNLNVFKEIIITRTGGVVSSHCGPRTLGIFYVSR